MYTFQNLEKLLQFATIVSCIFYMQTPNFKDKAFKHKYRAKCLNKSKLLKKS